MSSEPFHLAYFRGVLHVRKKINLAVQVLDYRINYRLIPA